jgi:predicted membrane-bound spermidine synthase
MRLLAIALISAGAIGYEILLMRLYSIVQWHHFAFMIISIALLGYGASGTFLVFARAWLVARFFAAWRVCALLFGVSAYGGFALAQRLAFNPLEITWEPEQLLLLGATYALLLVPFFFAATCIGLAFSRFGERIAGVYAADLGGAGLGAIAAVLLMMVLPAELGLIAVLASGPLAAAAARIDRGSLLLVGVALLCVLVPQSWITPQLSEYKGLRVALLAPGARIVAERHSPIGRITVVESPRVPFRVAPGLSLTSPHVPGEQLGLFIDGEGPQPITRFTGDLSTVAYLDHTTEAAPYHARSFERVLVLNAGTGAPVLLARYHHVQHVDAVEPNPSLADLMRGAFASYAGHIYSAPVTLHDTDIRTFVASTSNDYDLINLPLSASRGGSIMSGISETYAYTNEALRRYLARLAPSGMVAITREAKNPPRDALKLIATAIDALAAYGVADPKQHLVLIHSWQTFTLLIKNGPFHERELAGLKTFMAARSFDAGYYPGMRREEANRYNVLDAPYYYDGATALLGGERRRFMANYKFDLAPATDNRPFFDNFFRWSSLPEQLSLHSAAGFPLAERGYLILLATLAQAAVIALVLIVSPLALLRSQGTSYVRWRTLAYFFALGLAFLFIEMAFIQRFTLFLGQPIYAVSIVLASFLVFAGLGAAISGWVSNVLGRGAVIAVVGGIVVLAIAFEAVIVPGMFDIFLQGAPALKAAATAMVIAPLAFLMGMPFPIGLARLAEQRPEQVPWAWGINGCASVLSPVLASLFAIHWGFDAVILLAVGLYAAAAAVRA